MAGTNGSPSSPSSFGRPRLLEPLPGVCDHLAAPAPAAGSRGKRPIRGGQAAGEAPALATERTRGSPGVRTGPRGRCFRVAPGASAAADRRATGAGLGDRLAGLGAVVSVTPAGGVGAAPGAAEGTSPVPRRRVPVLLCPCAPVSLGSGVPQALTASPGPLRLLLPEGRAACGPAAACPGLPVVHGFAPALVPARSRLAWRHSAPPAPSGRWAVRKYTKNRDKSRGGGWLCRPGRARVGALTGGSVRCRARMDFLTLFSIYLGLVLTALALLCACSGRKGRVLSSSASGAGQVRSDGQRVLRALPAAPAQVMDFSSVENW